MLCYARSKFEEYKMPDFSFENKYGRNVVGIDEAGRGPWAGPVVAGAVMFKNQDCNRELVSMLDDSKKLSAKKREKIYQMLFEEQNKGNLVIGIGQAEVEEIDNLNILNATFLAMNRAFEQLNTTPDMVLVDGNQTPRTIHAPCKTLVKGDAKSCSIAAASIVAKVYRDNLMKNLAEKYPFYGFEKNAGYGTKAHIEGLNSHGVTSIHRRSYKPIQEFLASGRK